MTVDPQGTADHAAEAHAPAWWEEHPLWLAAALVALVAVAASFTGLWNGFAYDDQLVIRENPMVRTLHAPQRYFLESYWGPVSGHPSLYRPVIVLAWALQWGAADGAPWVFHGVNVILYALVCVSLLYFLRQLVGHGAATVGAMLFAAHPVHVEAVANVVGQSELLVGALLLSSLALYARDRKRGALTRRTQGWIIAGFVLGLFTKEHAIVLPALLVAVELAGNRVGFAPASDALVRLRRLVLLLGLIATAYLAWRAQLLGEVTGDLPHFAMRDRTIAERALIMLGVLPEIVRLLLYPARLYADYAPAHIAVLPEPSAGHLPGLLALLVMGSLMVLAWRRRWTLPLLGASWFAVTFAPTSNLLFPIGVILAERTLFLPSVAVAIAAAWAANKSASWPRIGRALSLSVVGAAVLFGSIHSANRTRVWADNATLFSTLAVEAPTNFRGQMALADFNARGGRWAVADSLYASAIALYPEQVPARMAYVQDLQVHSDFVKALQVVRGVLALEPENPEAIVAEALSLLHLQRFSEARARLNTAVGLGFESSALVAVRRAADSMLVVTDSADARNRFLREGRAVAKWTSPLVVTVSRELRRRLDAMQSMSRSAIGGADP